MSSITKLLSDDHIHCDDLFAEAEAGVARRDWASARGLFGRFFEAMRHHFAAEEETLFPAFEARTGMGMGPTQVMRAEHEQMRDLLTRMRDSLDREDSDGYLGLSETLLMLMRQHNLKEEQVLYPMSDQVLADAQDSLVPALEQALRP